MLDLRRLAVLEAVSRHGSFTAAGQALGYTQSAISQQIATLEKETGNHLVVRTGRRIWLSDAGNRLTDHARRILAAAADAEAELAAVTELRAGTVRLAAFPSAGATLVPLAAALFRQAHPRITLTVIGAEPVDAVNGLRSGAYDIAVTLAHDKQSESGEDSRPLGDLHRTPLLTDAFRLVLPQDHPLTQRKNVRLADLADETWISTSAPNHPDADTLARACAAAGFAPRIAFHIDDYQAVQGFIAARVGIALIPRLALVAVRSDVAVRTVTPEPSRVVEAVTIASRPPTRTLAVVLDALRTAATEVRDHVPSTLS